MCCCPVEVFQVLISVFGKMGIMSIMSIMSIHFKLNLGIIFMVLDKNLNYVADKTINAGNTASTGCNY